MSFIEIPTSLLLSFNISIDGGRAGVTVFLRAGVTVFLRAGVAVFLRAGGSGWRNTCATTLKMSLSVHGAVPCGDTICSHAPGFFRFLWVFLEAAFSVAVSVQCQSAKLKPRFVSGGVCLWLQCQSAKHINILH